MVLVISTIDPIAAQALLPGCPTTQSRRQTQVVLEILRPCDRTKLHPDFAERQDLPLNTDCCWTVVQKKLSITDDAAALLRKQGLIEGRKPKLYPACGDCQGDRK